MKVVRQIVLCCGCVLIGMILLSCQQQAKSVSPDSIQVTSVTGADVQKLIREPGAKAILVNMWATWCGPCREEFPGLAKVAQQYRGKGLRVLLVSADDPNDMAAVKKFLADEGVSIPAYIKAEKDQPFIDAMDKDWNGSDKRWDGALPATFIYGGDGKLRDYWEGEATFNVFEQKVVEALGNQTKPAGGQS